MPLFENGQQTAVKKGDELCVDTHNQVIQIRRKGAFLTHENSSDVYCFLPDRGEGIEVLAELVADAAGLGFKEIDDPVMVVFQFI